MADGRPRVESLLLELVGALLGRSDRSSRHHSRSGGRSLSPEHCRCCSRRRHSRRSTSYDRHRRSPVDRRSRERSWSSGRSDVHGPGVARPTDIRDLKMEAPDGQEEARLLMRVPPQHHWPRIEDSGPEVVQEGRPPPLAPRALPFSP